MSPPRLAVAVAALAALAAADASSASASGRCACVGATTDCSRRRLAALQDADLCPDATTIDVHANAMTVFPRQLRGYRAVLASENRFSVLPNTTRLSNSVRVLDLSRNKLSNSSQELRASSQLQVLRVKGNFLASLDFLPRPCALFVLDAADNSVTALEGPLQNCYKLVFLSLSKNQIASVGVGLFANMKKLKDLFLDSNMIQTISDGAFVGLKNLRCLSLARNLLRRLPPPGAPQLRRLDLSGNALVALPAALLAGAQGLQALDVHGNRLRALPPALLRGQHALRELRVWKNKLEEIPELQDCCERLEVANFDSNNLSSSGQEALRSLTATIRARLRGHGQIPP